MGGGGGGIPGGGGGGSAAPPEAAKKECGRSSDVLRLGLLAARSRSAAEPWRSPFESFLIA